MTEAIFTTRNSNFALPRPVRIRAIQDDNYRTKTFVLDAALDAYPGQFVMAWLPRFDEKPFSLVNADPVTLMITAVGPFSRLMHEKQPGDLLWLRGPFGRGYILPERGKRLALVGGGVWRGAVALAGPHPIGRGRCSDGGYRRAHGRGCALRRAFRGPVRWAGDGRHHRRWQPRAGGTGDGRVVAPAGTGGDRRHLRLWPPRDAGRAGSVGPTLWRGDPTFLGSVYALRDWHLRRVRTRGAGVVYGWAGFAERGE